MKTKRFLALILTLAMLVTMTGPALAEDIADSIEEQPMAITGTLDMLEGGPEDADEDADAAENGEGDDDANGVGHLSVNDVDYGTILFGGHEEPMPFILFEDEQETGERVLTIIPDPMEDAETPLAPIRLFLTYPWEQTF